MISKAQVKFIRLLHQKKYRSSHLLFIAEGSKIAVDIIDSRLKVHKIYATAAWLIENKDILENHPDIEANEVSADEMEKISALDTPQDVLLVIGIPESNTISIDDKAKIILVADSIRDPGNLGTIVRICDWYGIKQLFCSEDCAEIYNPKTVRATMGSIGRVEVFYTDIKEMIHAQKGRKRYAATLNGNINVHKLNNGEPVLLIIGNEAHGVSEEIISLCDDTIMIPRIGKAESLNASIATAVLVDNLVRINESNGVQP
jgi:TrmH family RNA methyltransferase